MMSWAPFRIPSRISGLTTSSRRNKDLGKFNRPESPADMFSLQYGDLSANEDDREWDVWTKVVARRDIEARLMSPWNNRNNRI